MFIQETDRYQSSRMSNEWAKERSGLEGAKVETRHASDVDW